MSQGVMNDIAMYTYYDIKMYKDITMNLFYYVLLCPIRMLLFSQWTL